MTINTSPALAVKPRGLRAGSTLAVLSPASTPKPELVQQGVAHLHALGYKAVPGVHALDSGPLYYAGTLADRLNDLSTALTNLVQDPTSAVNQSQALASLTAVDGLLAADPALSALIPGLTADGATLAQATTATAVQAAVSALGNDLVIHGANLSLRRRAQ